MNFTDAIELTGVNVSRDGYLTGHVKCARTGCQVYAGSEVGRPELDTVTVYRAEDEVFNKKSMGSFAGKPITLGHPTERVVADNWSKYARGHLGEDVARDGETVRVSLALMDGGAVKEVQSGKRQLSAGYVANLVWESGTAPDGTHYDARQTDIYVDHLAVVDAARGGEQLRIGDSADHWGAQPLKTTVTDERTPDMTGANMRTVMVDGFSVQTTDQGAQAIEKLQRQLKDAETAKTEADEKSKKDLEAKDKELATKDGEIEKLKKQVVDEKALDELVGKRQGLVDSARKVIADFDPKGKTDAEVRKAVVAEKLGDEYVKDRTDAYIDARFDMLVEDAGEGEQTHHSDGDPIRRVARDHQIKKTDGDVWGDSAFANAGVQLRK